VNYVEKCVVSLIENSGGLIKEIIVVDNSPEDTDKKDILDRFPEIIYLPQRENIGFASGNNAGIKAATGDFFLFLNPDTEVLPDSIEILHKKLKEDSKAGISVPKLFSPAGEEDPYYYKFPNLFADFFKSFHLEKLVKILELEKIAKKKFSRPRKYIEKPSGCCLLVRRQVVEDIALWDEDYGIYYEDDDLFWRAQKKGWKILYVSDAKVIHYVGKSSEEISSRKNALALPARFRFCRKNFGFYAGVLFFLIHWRKLLKYKIKYGVCFFNPKFNFDRFK